MYPVARCCRYRKWRTERKVIFIVALTWVIPIAVFFPSIFGWQHFVGKRTVPDGKCFVQYMYDALFNCLLQVSSRTR
jgi:muscarinic acetylcholine receptor M3